MGVTADCDKDQSVRDPIRVVLVDDHELARHGVRQLLASDSDIEVVGEAESSWGAISLITRLRPEVAILDIRLRQGNGIEVSRSVKKLSPDTRILVLSAYDDSQYVVSMVKLGVSGYLTKSSSAQDLIKAVHYAARGWLVFSPDIADKLADLLQRDDGGSLEEGSGEDGLGEIVADRSRGSLTGREAEVLQHLFRGLRNRDIADAMGISCKTVNVHIHRILQKLGARNRSQAIVNSLGLGYLQGKGVPAGVREGSSCGPVVTHKRGGSPERGS